MNNADLTVKNNNIAQNDSNKPDTKKPVDVATLEKSEATSETDNQSPDPVAVGEAGG